MLYKTIVLELLQNRPEWYEQLRSKRMLLATLEHYANQLKASHKAWKDELQKARPGSHESQIASEAMEFALQELENYLPTESPPDDNEPISLDVAMTFLRQPTPPG